MNSKKLATLLTSMLFMTLVVGCSSKSSPSGKELATKFALDIPGYWSLNNFDIEISENVGSETEPVVKSRYVAELKLKEDTYEHSRSINDVPVIKPVKSAGDKVKIYGVATSIYRAGKWDVHFAVENNPTRNSGKPKAEFGSNAVLSGSKKEQELTTNAEARRDAVVQEEITKRNAEATKKKALAEQHRSFLLKLVKSGKSYAGETSERGETLPFKITFSNVNTDGTKFTARLDMLRFTSATKIEGEVFGAKLLFKETAYITKAEGNKWNIGDVYELEVNDEHSLVGTRYVNNRRAGPVELKIE